MTHRSLAFKYRMKYLLVGIILFIPMLLFGWFVYLLFGYSYSDYESDCVNIKFSADYHMRCLYKYRN